MTIEDKLGVQFEEAKQEMSTLLNQEGINKSESKPAADYELDYDEMSEIDEIKDVMVEDKKEIATIDINAQDIAIQNQEYIDSNIKELVDRNKAVLKLLEDDIKEQKQVNMRPQMYNVFASVSNAISMLLREMREVSKLRVGIDVIPLTQLYREKFLNKDKENEKEKPSSGITLSSSQLLKLINEAKKEGNVNAEDAIYEEVTNDKSETTKAP